jgi:lactate dehydrogenase-like 2-hydroxyacid dehydrogenase
MKYLLAYVTIKMKVFVTRIIPEVGLKKMLDAGLEVIQWEEQRDMEPQELIEACKQADALLSAGGKIDAHFLNECKHLKVIALHSVGFDSVDVAEATRLKIPIGNTPGVLSGTTADTAFLLMLAVSRKAFYQHKRILKGEWNFFEPTANLGIELHGKTIGIYGLGKIGYEMARRCIAMFDMKVIYYNRHNNLEAEKELNAVKVSFDELIAQSDVLSVHVPLTQETKGQFDKSVFNTMKPTSIFINTARGGIHNEEDLIQALESGVIWGAGLDVTNPEPMHPDNPLLNMPTVAVLPHIGSATVETRNAMSLRAAENIIAGLKGEQLPYPVNPEVFKNP